MCVCGWGGGGGREEWVDEGKEEDRVVEEEEEWVLYLQRGPGLIEKLLS